MVPALRQPRPTCDAHLGLRTTRSNHPCARRHDRAPPRQAHCGQGIYRDPIRSPDSHFVKASGLRWMSLMLLARVRGDPQPTCRLGIPQQIFAKLKALLRTAAARTVPDLRDTIRHAFTRFTPDECRNCLAAGGYDNDLAVAT